MIRSTTLYVSALDAIMMSCSARDRSLVIHARPWRFSALRRLFAHHSVSIPVSHEPVGRMLPVHRRDAVLPRLLVCVGILKDWLLRALQRALVSQRAALCWDDLEVTRLLDLGLLHIAEEIREFREMEGRSYRSEIESALGLSGAAPPQARRPRLKRSSPKPGRRAPARDSVGVAGRNIHPSSFSRVSTPSVES